MTFNYTDELDRGSSAVDDAYYNEGTNELLVVVAGGSGYLYTNVPDTVWREFKNASSVGRYYARTIKRNHGPGEYKGYDPEVERGVPAPSMAAVGTPKGLNYAPGAVVTNITNNSGLTGGSFGPHISLSGNAIVSERRHEVVFVVEGLDAERIYNTNATDVNAAVEALNEVAAALDLTFRVKRVVTHFE